MLENNLFGALSKSNNPQRYLGASVSQLGITYISVAILMFFYELAKETIFKGSLTAWESHTITIVVTATFATMTAFWIRKKTQQLGREIRDAHNSAADVIRNMIDGVIIMDDKGVIQTFNPAAELIFGHQVQAVIGKNITALLAESDAAEYINDIKTIAKSDKTFQKSKRIEGKRANGTEFPLDLIIKQMQINDRTMFIGVARDITEFKNAQKELDRLREIEKATLKNIQGELSIAAEIQMNMIPKNESLYPEHPQVKAFGISRPAKEMGGDFYEAFSIDSEHIVLAIGDVSGKGIPAAMFMTKAMTLLRSEITNPHDLASALVNVNYGLCQNNDSNMFVTLFVGVFNVSTGSLNYINAGHDFPLIGKPNKIFTTFAHARRDIIMGINPAAQYESTQTQLDAGDTIVLYTDGVTEAENQLHELFTLARAKKSLSASGLDARTLVDNLAAEISNFCGDHPQSDDITIFALQYRH